MDKGKMSKSSGNFLTLQYVIDQGYDPLDYRLFLLGGHYRSQLTFSWESMDGAKIGRKSLVKQIAKIAGTVKREMPARFAELRERRSGRHFPSRPRLRARRVGARTISRFSRTAVEQDLNTPSRPFRAPGLVRDPSIEAEDALETLAMDGVLGLSLIASAARALDEEESPTLESDPPHRRARRRARRGEKGEKLRASRRNP